MTMKQGLNLFDDLSKTVSNGAVQNKNGNSQSQVAQAELNFKNITQKIGFKRKANDLQPSLSNEFTNKNKKVKKI